MTEKKERSVLWFRWDHLSSGGVRADTYPLLSCVKPGWGSRAASGQTEQEARTTMQTDRRAVQTRCPRVRRLSDHNIYNLPSTSRVICMSSFISFSSPRCFCLTVISLIDFHVKRPPLFPLWCLFLFKFIQPLL